MLCWTQLRHHIQLTPVLNIKRSKSLITETKWNPKAILTLSLCFIFICRYWYEFILETKQFHFFSLFAQDIPEGRNEENHSHVTEPKYAFVSLHMHHLLWKYRFQICLLTAKQATATNSSLQTGFLDGLWKAIS